LAPHLARPRVHRGALLAGGELFGIEYEELGVHLGLEVNALMKIVTRWSVSSPILVGPLP
jgi:hypothetical protein